MKGVALEGGGARGAYHVGAMKALYEQGQRFDGYVGTSIGAINAAALAQGDFEKLAELWQAITPSMLFSEPVARLLGLGERSLSGDFARDLTRLVEELHREGIRKGVDTSRMKRVIGGLIDEGKLRASGKCYGLVTVCVNELKPYQMLLPDIPEGRLLDYVMASASFPGFQPEVIDGNTFLDGGLYNNCPVNLLTEEGFDEVIAIRTLCPGLFYLPRTRAKITVITPSRELGNVMSFDNALARRNITIGYLDALRTLGVLCGRSYYVEPWQAEDADKMLLSIPDEMISQMRETFLLPDLPPKRLLFERVLPELGAYLKLPKDYGYGELVLALLEDAAEDAGVEPLQRISLPALSKAILEAGVSAPEARRPRIRRALLGDHRTAIRHLGTALARQVCGA